MLKGIDYYRVIEYSTVASCLNQLYGCKILDIGSLDSLFPLFLATKGAEVHAIDINQKVLELNTLSKRLGVNNFHALVMDATKLNYPDNFFDIVTAISTIEHILPLDEGDTEAMKEIARVLKPGGIAVITVPYETKFSEEWRNHPSHGKYLRRGYDNNSIYSRLIHPSKLSLLKIYYFCDDVSFWKMWYKILVFLFAPISFIFSRLFLKLRTYPVNAKGVIIILGKVSK
jgi:2-polyprenyl-3-methyl-5-hydroxy-6-metoxy-1,4-benzoquinol methylase